jgi:hypothetical protein
MELDIEAAAGAEIWICESKWWRDRKAGVHDVEILIEKGNLFRLKEGAGLKTLRSWFFSYSGFTDEAIKLIKEVGMFWSSKTELNSLLDHASLRRLPDL